MRWLNGLIVGVLLVTSAPVRAEPLNQVDPTLQECSQIDEAALQDELNALAQAVFARALAEVNLAAIVDAEWQTLRVDAVIDAEIDRAVAAFAAKKRCGTRFFPAGRPSKLND